MALFPRPQSQTQGWLQAARGNPQAAANNLMRTNPDFARFVRDNQGKTPQQIAQEHGIPYEAVLRMMG